MSPSRSANETRGGSQLLASSPHGSAKKNSSLRDLISILALAVLYFLAARVGLSLASVHTNVSPVWPPTGIAMAAILLLGYRVWPGILLGAFLANFLTPVSVETAGAIAVGNTLEAVSAGWILRSIGFHDSLDRARDVFKFVLAATLCTIISATIGNVSLCLGHAARWTDFALLWRTWWLGDLTGAVTVAPLLLTWGSGKQHWLPQRRYLEACLLILLLALSAIVTFGKTSPAPSRYYPLTRLIVPFLLWAAFRLGRRGVTLALLVVSAFAVWGTAQGSGPFIGDTPNESLLVLQLFLSSNAVTFLFLSGVVEERRRSEQMQHEHERRLAANLAITRILAESPALNDATPRILETVGESLRWEVGGMWTPDPDAKVLRNVTVWRQIGSKADAFERICRERTFEKGIGLPGRVWASLTPAWIQDIAKDDNFPRATVAIAEGLHGAFAFPILFADKFLGVMEFFSHEIREPDEALLEMFDGIGKQVGQFMQRKSAEEALIENREWLNLTMESSQMGTWTRELDETNRVIWSAELERIFGLEPGEFPQTEEGFFDFVHPDDREALGAAVREAIENHADYDFEFRYKRKDGSERWMLGRGRAFYDETGKPYRLAGLGWDITERKRTEQVLRHLAAIVESTDDAVISKDLNGIITSWNPAAGRLYGYTAAEVVGQPVSILLPPERPDEEPAILGKLRRGEPIDHYETVRMAKDGRRIHVSLTVSPIRDATGKIIGASKIARDITEQKRSQHEITKLLALERTARQEAEIANRTKDEFLAVLSHELRTPLTAILGWLSILRGHSLDEQTTRHALETIERNAKVQAQLIEDLVDVSRIVGGKLNLKVQPIDLLPVINAAVEVVRPAANAKDIRINVNYDSTVGAVSGDTARLQQVIWNLLANAVKFTSKGGSVDVESRRDGSSAEVLVRDTGIGIPADFLPHVFERFRQAESAVTRSHSGMGLGLAIVRHLVELHGGTVTAHSDGENQGATFIIRLPLAAVKRPAVAAEEEFAKANGDDGALSGVRILLVEDEPDARELIALALKRSGANVEAVDSAGNALARMQSFTPDVLLSDIGLPVESGYDLIRSIRALPSELSQVPAIALTAFATENDRQKSISEGFHEHLAKPVEPGHLVEVIKLLVNGRS